MYQRLTVIAAASGAILAAFGLLVGLYHLQGKTMPGWLFWSGVGAASFIVAVNVEEWVRVVVLIPLGHLVESLECQWPVKRKRVPPHQWLLEIAEADRDNPAATLVLVEPSVDLRHIAEPDPYVVFTLRIFNGCIYPVSVQSAGGDVYWRSSPLARGPELTEGKGGCWERGNVMRVRLRQWLPEEVADSLRSRGCNVDDGIVREFAFDSVYLMVKARPDGSPCVRYGFGHLSEFIAATNR
jgi:hypothetical protein